MEKSVLLIRHGAVDSPIGPNGPLIYGPNQPLNTEGKHQLIRLGETLQLEKMFPEAIYTSPYSRAKESANVLHDILPSHPPVLIREGLRGASTPQWDNRPEKELVAAAGNLLADNPNMPGVKGETLQNAYWRVVTEFKRLLAESDGHPMVIVTHGEIIGMLRHYFKMGENAAPGIEASPLQKGEAMLCLLDAEGKLLEERLISGEGQTIHPEKRG